jgi:hypothetical protein
MSAAATKLGLARDLARVTATAVTDKIGLTGSAPTHAHPPASAARLTPEWLTGALCSAVPGGRVLSFDVTGGCDGTSSRRVLRIAYNDAGVAAGLPTSVFTKTSAGLGTRILLGLSEITTGEATFFNDLRPHVDLRSPHGYHAVADERTCRSIVVMEDLAASGWTFPDPMADRVSEADAADMIEQLASYHAAFWDGGRAPAALGRLPSSLLFQQRLNGRSAFVRQFERGVTRSRAHLPARVVARREQLWPAVMRSLEVNGEGPVTLLHQDLHHGNWLRDPDGRMGLYDWQCVARGGWAMDVAYALIVPLEPGDRRAWQEDLVHHYLELLRDRDVPGVPAFIEAWADVRRQPMHAFAFGLFTNGQPRLAPELQPRDYTLRCIERLGLAVDEWDTLEWLA